MNREDLIRSEELHTRRWWAVQPIELRAADRGLLTFDGIASVTEHGYDVYGGPDEGGWVETVARGAFKKTLSEKPDVAFLVNHEGMTLARTKSGTLRLTETDVGLRAQADLDPRMHVVNDLKIAVERGDIDEMSFAFRVTKDEWSDERGEPATWMDGTQRRILEVSLHKGDVSAVRYGANPATSGAFRDAELAFAELRAGRKLRPESRDALARLLDDEDRASVVVIDPGHPFTDGENGHCDICGGVEADHLTSIDPRPLIALHDKLLDPPEAVVLLQRHHERLMPQL